MLIDEETIRNAFQANDEIYANNRNWAVGPIADAWDHGRKAFSGVGDLAAFNHLYDLLKNYWKVFRPQSTPPEPECLHRVMMRLTRELPTLREMSLSGLSSNYLPQLEAALSVAPKFKDLKRGPSLMAASKFFHFWNPRLFVIVDREVMENYVLHHRWIEHRWIEKEIRDTQGSLPHGALKTWNDLSYIGILLWASNVMRKNTAIRTAFAQSVKKVLPPENRPNGFEDFEGAAFEWFIRGLVELPPAGVSNLSGA